MTEPKNLLFLLSDNHARGVLGCYGHPLVSTPHLDRLAGEGVRFENAYCASPLCCPSRASIATGLYPHETGYWDNALPYDGARESWMHRLRGYGHPVVSIGKLHFRSTDDDNGFSEEIAPMHVVDGRGGVATLLRSGGNEPPAGGQWQLYTERSGIGDTPYQDYDRDITRRAVGWLLGPGRRSPRPWALFVSYVSPHPPFLVPSRLYDRYPLHDIDLPPALRADDRAPEHPAIRHLRDIMGTREHVDPAVLRRIAAGYFGLITHLDEQVGEVLAALAEAGLEDDTRVVYTSDHGEMFGAHRLFGKCNMYEGAIGVPLVMAGPGIRRGGVVRQIASHVDLFPTIVESVSGRREGPEAQADTRGETAPNGGEEAGGSARGASVWPALEGSERVRPGFVEYHATGSRAGSFVLRRNAMKLIYHVGMPLQLFDLDVDPDEEHDRTIEAGARPHVEELEAALREICDPEEVDTRAKRDQAAKIAFWGGEEAVRREGRLVFTPPPGVEAEILPNA